MIPLQLGLSAGTAGGSLANISTQAFVVVLNRPDSIKLLIAYY